MRSIGSKLFLAVMLAVMGSAAVARAEETSPENLAISKPISALPWFVGLSAGAGYMSISHPEIATGGAPVAVFTLNGGYTFGDHLSLGLEFSSSETTIGRDSGAEQFQLGHKPQAIWLYPACSPCEPKPGGSDVVHTSLVFSTLGARVEYAPFRRDGLFVGGTAGLAFLVGIQGEAGFGFNGRVGYRIRATNVLALSIEAGMAGQVYGDTTMYLPFAVASVRPYFEKGIRPYPKKPAKPAQPAQ